MNYNTFDIEALILIGTLNENGYTPTHVNTGPTPHEGICFTPLKEENKTDWLGKNNREQEAVDLIMSVHSSEVTVENKEGVIFGLSIVRGNNPGELVNRIAWGRGTAKCGTRDFDKFEKVLKTASESFKTWVEINDKYLSNTGIAIALGADSEEAMKFA
jgi:hypothetical protein